MPPSIRYEPLTEPHVYAVKLLNGAIFPIRYDVRSGAIALHPSKST
jgi:hypothetical protein